MSEVTEMTHVSISKAQARISELVGRVRYGREGFVLTSRGHPAAAMVSIEYLAALESAYAANSNKENAK